MDLKYIVIYVSMNTISCEAVLFDDTVAIDDIDSTHIWTINNLCTDPSVIAINTCVFTIEVTTKCVLCKQIWNLQNNLFINQQIYCRR